MIQHKEASDLTEGIDVCRFKQSMFCQQTSKKNLYNGCCHICKHLKDGKCTTSNLACVILLLKSKRKIFHLELKDIKICKLYSKTKING